MSCYFLRNGSKRTSRFDYTFPDFRAILISNPKTVLDEIDHLIIGVHVYAEKLLIQVIECLNIFNGNVEKCNVVVIYDNRDYGVSFRNMTEMLIKKGFKVVAAGAFIGQQTYSNVISIAIGI